MSAEQLSLIVAGTVAIMKVLEFALLQLGRLFGLGRAAGKTETELEALTIKFEALSTKVNHHELQTREAYDHLRREMTCAYGNLQKEVHDFHTKVALNFATKTDLYRVSDQILQRLDAMTPDVSRRRPVAQE